MASAYVACLASLSDFTVAGHQLLLNWNDTENVPYCWLTEFNSFQLNQNKATTFNNVALSVVWVLWVSVPWSKLTTCHLALSSPGLGLVGNGFLHLFSAFCFQLLLDFFTFALFSATPTCNELVLALAVIALLTVFKCH